MKKTGDTRETGVVRKTGSRRKAGIRGRAIAFAAGAMLAITGCGNGEKPAEVGTVKPVDISGEELAGGGQDLAGEGEPDLAGGGGQASAGADGQQTGSGNDGKGYLFAAKGVTVSIDAEAGPITEQLGEPLSYFESESCAFEGLDKIYTYSGFELDTYPKGGKDYISAVVLTDDTVSTPEGIAIGDSLEKVKEAYPGEYTEICSMLRYEKGGMTLSFIIQDNEVKSIEYRSTALR